MIKINRRVISVTSVLLILSVMLFIGSAAAAVSASDRTASNTSINPGETVDITVDVQTDQSGDDVLINDSFNGPISSATGSVVESANGTATGPIDENGSAVLVSSPDPNSNITLVYNITANSSTGAIDIVEGSDSNTSMGTTTIDVTSPRGSAPSVAAASRTVSANTINTGEIANVTVDIKTNQTGADITFNDTIAGPVSSVTGSVVDSANGNVVVSVFNENRVFVDVTNPDENSNITLTYNITANSSTGSIDIVDGSNSDASIGTTIINVNSSAGSAGPAVSANRTVSTNSIKTGETTNVTLEIQTNQNGDNVTAVERFDGSVDSADGQVVDSVNGTIANNSVDSQGANFTILDPDPNSNITIEYNITAGTKSGTITVYNASNSDLSLANDTISVGGGSNSGNTSLNISEVDGKAGGIQRPQPVTAILDLSSDGQPYSGVVNESKLTIEVGSESVTSGFTVDKRRPGIWAVIFFAPTQSTAGTYDLNVSFDDDVLGNNDTANRSNAVVYSSTGRVQASVTQIIDESGSMGRDSPERIVQARAGSEQVLRGSDANDYLSIVGFDFSADINQPLTRKQGNFSEINNSIYALNAGGGTDIEAATRTGLNTFDNAPKGTTKAAILLTDGRDQFSRSPVLNDVIPKYNSRNVCLYTVGFGTGADEQLLKDFANASDCGNYRFAASQGSAISSSENTLDKVLTDIKGEVSGEETVETSDGNVSQGETISKSYNVDSSVNVKSVSIDAGNIPSSNISLSSAESWKIKSADESSLVSTTQSDSGTVRLIDPDGNIIASDANQDVEISVLNGQVTYRIQDPQTGQWNYEIVNQGSNEISYQTEVKADAQASLDVSSAASTYYETGSAGITALFYGPNGDIENADVTADVIQPDGTNKTVSFTEVNPGVYKSEINLPDNGSYSIKTDAEKGNIFREGTKSITAKPLSKSPVSVSTQSSGEIDAGKSGTVDVQVSVGSGGVSQQLDVGISQLTQVGGNDAIQTSKISIGTQRISVAAGSSQTVTASVDAPASAADGTYNGTASVYRPDGSVVTDTVSVEVNNPLPAGAVYSSPNSAAAQFDTGGKPNGKPDGKLSQPELGAAGQAYLNGRITQSELGSVGQAYLQS